MNRDRSDAVDARSCVYKRLYTKRTSTVILSINSIHRIFSILGILSIFSLIPLRGQDEAPKALQVGGYLKYLQTSTFLADQPMITNHLLHHRFNVKWFVSDHWQVAVESRNRIFYGEQVKLTPNFAASIDQYDGLVDLSALWIDHSDVVFHSLIDRAYVKYSKDKWDITLGRQRINWGINLVWNPNDLYNAFNFFDFDYEERPGADALRVQYYPGLLSSAEVAIAPGRSWETTTAAAMYKFNVKSYDIQLLGGYYRGDVTLGTGWSGYVGGAGFKGEVSYFFPSDPDTSRAVSISLMSDYQFGGIYTGVGLLYNRWGQNSQFGTQTFAGAGELSPQNLFPSQWAFFGQVSAQPHPLLSVSGAVIYATNQNLTALIPTITYSIVENWDLDLVGQVFLMNQNQRYNLLATSVFLRLKWSY